METKILSGLGLLDLIEENQEDTYEVLFRKVEKRLNKKYKKKTKKYKKKKTCDHELSDDVTICECGLIYASCDCDRCSDMDSYWRKWCCNCGDSYCDKEKCHKGILCGICAHLTCGKCLDTKQFCSDCNSVFQ